MSAEMITGGFVKFFLNCLKLAPRYLITLGIAAAFLLFGNENLLKKLDVYNFAQDYRTHLSLILIITIPLFAIDRSIPIIHWIRNRVLNAKISKRIKKALHSLTEDEKKILRFYIFNQTKTNVLRIDDGIVKGLESKFIIFIAAPFGNTIEGFAYNISDIAWDYLNKNQGLLIGVTNYVRTDKRNNWLE